ncbi:FCD domain-containing protein [Streptosporangium sp. NPDC006013]|uniref:FadR/GntR family transcriptional regulator n=1 Tax=Streptosporangium sp. NPDC006013 TaxID=3155596 RepID=UPI0033ADBD2B
MNNSSRTRPQKTAVLIARRIIDDVRRNGYSVGDRLPSERLMLEDYQVGRGTLRESLRFLELQGVISLKPGPGGGPTLEKPDASNLATALVLLLQFENAPFRSVVEARVGLEPMMTRLAAERMTGEQLQRLAESVDGMRENLNDREMFLDTNKAFHDIIAWSSGNALFGFLIDALLGIIDGTALGVNYPLHRRSAVLKAHTRIFEALNAHDGDSSMAAMEAHIQEYLRYVEKKYPEAMAQPVTWDLL